MKLTNTHKTFIAGASGALVVFGLLAGGAVAARQFGPHGPEHAFERHGGMMGGRGIGMRGQRPANGVVQDINGKAIVIKDDENNTTTVTVDDSTKYSKDQAEAKLSDIKTGDTIIVFGKPVDNTVTAKRIIINPDFTPPQQ